VLPEVTARLDADVSGFISAWDRAADAAVRAAARIRAAQASIEDVDIDAGRFRDLNGELERLTRTVRQAADQMREFGNSSRNAGGGLDDLADRARRAGDALGGSGGGGLGGGFMKAGTAGKAMAAGVAIVASVLPAIAAAALAAGAALQGMAVVGAVVIGGWRGIEQAGERLKASLGGLQKQLESVFRAELSREFQKLGQAISQMDGPLKAIARSTSDVIKAFTGWIRSAEGTRQIEVMLGGVDNMMKSLAPGAKALAQAFTAFGEAAAPAMDEIGAALSSVFENLNKVIQKNKESGQLTKAFEAGAAAIEAFGEILAGVVDILIEMAASGGKPAAEALKQFGQAMQDAAPAIGVVFGHLARLMNVIATVVGWFAKLLKAMDPVTKALQNAGNAFDEFVKKGKGFEKLGGIVAAAFKLIEKAVKEGVDKAIQAVKKWWDDTKKAVEKGVEDAKKAVKKWWDDTKKAITKGVEDAKKAVEKWWTDTKKAVEKGVQDAIKAVEKWRDETVQAIEDGVADFIAEVEKWWDETVQGIKDGVQKAVDAVKELPEKALDALRQAVPDFKGVGEDMGEGMAEGLRSAASKLAAIAASAAANALQAAKNAMGIHSPSTVMRDEVGRMMVEGWAQGIIGNAGLVTDAMNRTALGALGAGRAGALGGAMGRGSGQTLTLQIAGGADGAVGVMIQRLAQQGKLKITSNAIVGARR
jgi:hypothetical protein